MFCGKEGRVGHRGEQSMPDVGASSFCMITFLPLVGGQYEGASYNFCMDIEKLNA